MSRQVDESNFVVYDFKCKNCKGVEERVVRRRDTKSQRCACDGKMVATFPLGKQLDYECSFKPIYDNVTSWDNKWVTSRGELRARMKRNGLEQCGDRQGGSTMGKRF